MLFIPFGLVLGALRLDNLKRVILNGLIFSFCIETIQFLFSLGIFEFDDLIHNTIGTVVGFCMLQKNKFKIEIKKKQLRVITMALFVALIIPQKYLMVHYRYMEKLASLHIREDGAKNLLVLNGKNGYAWNTDVYVKICCDGSIRINGTSDKLSWWPIGDLTLDSGKYSFSGLSNVEKETVGLVLEVDNHRIIEDVGPIDEVQFELYEDIAIKAYVIVYPDCDVIAVPVIYKEE